MKRRNLKTLTVIGGLIVLTCAAMAYSGADKTRNNPNLSTEGIISLEGNLSQEKVLLGEEGNIALSLTMTADDVIAFTSGDASPVDLIIVLDRSGSMRGHKLNCAKDAAYELLSTLSSWDRFALVSYSNRVTRHSGLMKVTPSNRVHLRSVIGEIFAGGGTNLGAGLKEGIELMSAAKMGGRMRKVILISDGLANHGVTDPEILGRILRSSGLQEKTTEKTKRQSR